MKTVQPRLVASLVGAGLYLQEIDPKTNRIVGKINHTSNPGYDGARSLWTIDIAYSISRINPKP